MLERLARLIVRRRKVVLVGAVVFLAVAGTFGGGVAEHLSSGGFQDPKAESTRAEEILTDEFDAADPNFVLLVTAKGGNVDDPAVATAGQALTDELQRAEGMELAVSYWTLGNAPPLKSRSGDQAIVLARIGGDEDEIDERVAKLTPSFTRETDLVDVRVSGMAEVFRQVGTTIEKDLAKAEGVAIPITLVLLVIVFAGVIAASLPLAIGVLAILGTFLVLRVLTLVTDVSIYSLNMTTAMGLGLAIDYSLFVVSRFREELRNGLDIEAAIVKSVKTAGRTVIFSAVAVAISLAALLVFPLFFLRSFAYAGIAVVTVAALGAVVVLPALLAVAGARVGKQRRPAKEVGEGFWHRAAVFVMRRPVPVAASVVALLLLLGAPFLGIVFGLPDDRVLPPNNPVRAVTDDLRENFDSFEAGALSVVLPGVDANTRTQDVAALSARLSQLDGVARVDGPTGSYLDGAQVVPPSLLSARLMSPAGSWMSVVPSVEPVSPEGEAVVKAVRAVERPFEEMLVGGGSAQLVDSKESLFGRMPLAAGLIALVTFTVLFLMFGSILVPLKAVILNLLSLAATFGAMVWIFQDGHLSGLLGGFTATGTTDTTTPILMFCIAFGLSMDYEVFLLSRIKEEYDRTGDNEASVAVGLERTGRIVTAAAALLAVVFLAMVTSDVKFIKLFGLGLAMAVVMDATLIRGALVPAFMRLAGSANWWAPAPLKRLYERFGFSESEQSADETDRRDDAVLDLTDRDESYRARVVAIAADCTTEAELRELMADERVGANELAAWGASPALVELARRAGRRQPVSGSA